MRVLLVDDDADQLELRGLTLGKAGYQVRTAPDAETALRLSEAELPEVAILDLRLPTEEGGLRLIRELKSRYATLRIIVLTGFEPRTFDARPERALVEAVFLKGGGSRRLVAHLKDREGSGLRNKLAANGKLVLEVKVIPRSSKSEIVEFLADGSVKVKLAAVPEKGKANEELISLFADYFGVRKDAVELLTGEASQRKRLRISAPKAT